MSDRDEFVEQAKNSLAETLEYLYGAALIAPSSKSHSEQDLAEVQAARKLINPDSHEVRAVIHGLEKNEHPEILLIYLREILEAARTIASRCIITDSTTSYGRSRQAKEAREALEQQRAESDQEQIIVRAVNDAMVSWDGEKPYKMGASISAELKRQGITIGPQAIANRLKKRSP